MTERCVAHSGQTLALLLALAIVCCPAPGRTFAQGTGPYPKLHSRLAELLQAGGPYPTQTKGMVRIDEASRVQVYVRATEITQELIEEIASLGGTVELHRGKVLQAWLPVNALITLAANPLVQFIEPPRYGEPQQSGPVTTEGDAKIGAATVRQQFGASGRGVRVGVISDGILGLGTSIQKGYLPATTFQCQSAGAPFTVTSRSSDCQTGEKLIGTSGGVTAVPVACQNLAPGAVCGGNLASGDGEGTAMLEIVHAHAPSAELWFSNGLGTDMDLEAAWTYLAANVDIVVSDVNFFSLFPDGQSEFTQCIGQVVAGSTDRPDCVVASSPVRARGYFQSIGNAATHHYAGLYTDSGVPSSLGGDFHLFPASAAPCSPICDAITIPPTTPSQISLVNVFLSWRDQNSKFGLVLHDCNLQPLPPLCSQGTCLPTLSQNFTGLPDPDQRVTYLNVSTSNNATFCYSIWNHLNLSPRVILNVLINPNDDRITHTVNTPAMSLEAPADAQGNLTAVGAVYWQNWGTSNVIESFSSHGPTFDGRSKPDVVAPDGVSTSGAAGFDPSSTSTCTSGNCFFGTSAAAPHVAGLAALLLELSPTLTSSQLKSVLQKNATPVGDTNTYGGGLLNGSAAATQAVALAPMLSVFPTGTLDFGTVAGLKSADGIFSVTNAGMNPLSGTASTSPPYTIVAHSSFNLQGGASQTVSVRFSPAIAGTYAGNVNFTSNGGATSRVVTGTATQTAFTDPIIMRKVTKIRAEHVTELRTTVDALRAKFLLPAVDWTDRIMRGVTKVKVKHFTEMQTALTEAYRAAGKQAPTFTNPSITPMVTIIMATDFLDELRNDALALE